MKQVITGTLKKSNNKKKKPKIEDDTFFYELNISIPSFLNPEIWKKYKYSYDDVVLTIKSFKSYHLQILCLLLKCPVSNVIKLSYNSETAMGYSSKAIITKKLETHLKNKDYFSENSVLDKTLQNHVPPLPIILCNKEKYDLAFSVLHGEINYSAPNILKNCLTFFNNELFVPIKTEAKYILMRRIVTKNEYYNARTPTKSLATQPVMFFLIENQTEYCAFEECFLLLLEDKKK